MLWSLSYLVQNKETNGGKSTSFLIWSMVWSNFDPLYRTLSFFKKDVFCLILFIIAGRQSIVFGSHCSKQRAPPAPEERASRKAGPNWGLTCAWFIDFIDVYMVNQTEAQSHKGEQFFSCEIVWWFVRVFLESIVYRLRSMSCCFYSFFEVYTYAKVYANIDFHVDIPLTHMWSRELIR